MKISENSQSSLFLTVHVYSFSQSTNINNPSCKARIFTRFNFWHCNCSHFSLISDYNNSTDLHIAVTTSQGLIVEFDRNGLRRHTPKGNKSLWEQSLVVETIPEAWWDFWDEMLSEVGFKSITHNSFR